MARLAGIFQALEGTAYTYGQVVVLSKLVVFGDAAATATNVLGQERLFWLGFASCLAGVAFHITWAFFMYELLEPVHRRLSFFALLVILVGCAVQAVTTLLYLAPLLVLKGGTSLAAFAPAQLQALALAFFRVNAYAFEIYLVFFGLWCFLTGLLIFKSTFLPRLLGVLLAIDGVGWMMYVLPPVAERLFPAIAVAAAVSEFPLLLWLLVFGVNEQRWREEAAAAAER